MKRYWTTLAIFLILLLSWEGVSRTRPDLSFVLPPPSLILWRLWSLSDRFFFHTSITLKEMAGGFTLAFAIAFPLAWAMDRFQSARLLLQPVFIIIQCIPMFALAPIMVIWFDWSYTAIVIPTALMIFFPLTMSIYQGLRATPTHLIEYFQVNQANARQVFFKLQLPWALPYIFGGFRISSAIAGIAAVAGEWAGGQAGLGVLMLESHHNADLETTFAALFCVALISLTLYGLTAGLETMVAQRKPFKELLRPWFKGIMTSVVFLTCVGCHQGERSQEEVRLTLDWLPNPNHIPLYVGIEKEFFSKRGIHLKIRKVLNSGDSIAYLTSKQSDLALSYMPRTIRLMARGASIEPIAVLIKEPLNAFIYRSGEDIIRPEDLNGKIIGYSVDGTQTTFLNAVLASKAIVPLEKRNAGFDLVCCLATKRVDVLYGGYWNIEFEHLRLLGTATDYFKLSDFGVPNYYELIVLARKGSPQSDPEFIQRFQAALQESIDYCLACPSEAFDFYFQMQLDKSPNTKIWERRAWEASLPALATSQEIPKEMWTAFSNWLRKNNLLN